MKIQFLKDKIRIYKDAGFDSKGRIVEMFEYYYNPFKNYRKRIEKELSEKYLAILKSKGIT